MNRRSAAITVTIILVLLFPALYGQTVTVDGTVIDKKQYPVENVLAKIASENFVEDSSFSNNLGQYELHIASVGIEDDFIPLKFSLNQNYPNPFNPSTTIKFTTTSEGGFIIHNVLGQEIAREKIPGPGSYTVKWGGANKQGKNVSAGIYLYTVLTSENKKTRKMILIDGGNGQKLSISGTMSQNANSRVLNEALNNEYILSFEKDNMTNFYLPVIINRDTTINQTVNVGPVVLSHPPDTTIDIGDTLTYNLLDYIYNDSKTFFHDPPIPGELVVLFDSLFTVVGIDTGIWDILLYATDSSDVTLYDSLYFQITIITGQNLPPIWIDSIPDFVIDEDEILTFDMTDYVYDPNGDSLEYWIVNIDYNVVGDIISIIPNQNWFGIVNSSITILEYNGEYVLSDQFDITIQPVNDAPSVELTEIVSSVDEDSDGLPLQIASFSVFDPDSGDSYTAYLINSNPDSVFLNIDGNIVSLDSLAVDFNGLVDYGVRVVDNEGLESTDNAVLTVNPMPDFSNVHFVFKAMYGDTTLTSGTSTLTYRKMLADTSGYVWGADSVATSEDGRIDVVLEQGVYDINGLHTGAIDSHLDNGLYAYFTKSGQIGIIEKRDNDDQQSPILFNTENDTIEVYKLMQDFPLFWAIEWASKKDGVNIGTRGFAQDAYPVNAYWVTGDGHETPDSVRMARLDNLISQVRNLPHGQHFEMNQELIENLNDVQTPYFWQGIRPDYPSPGTNATSFNPNTHEIIVAGARYPGQPDVYTGSIEPLQAWFDLEDWGGADPNILTIIDSNTVELNNDSAVQNKLVFMYF